MRSMSAVFTANVSALWRATGWRLSARAAQVMWSINALFTANASTSWRTDADIRLSGAPVSRRSCGRLGDGAAAG